MPIDRVAAQEAFGGKGIFIWQIHKILGGDIVAIVGALVEAGFERVELKVCDGPYVFDGPRRPLRLRFVAEAQAAGIRVVGWGFNYGIKPEGEGAIAATETEALGLDGYVFDSEGEFDRQKDAAGRARKVTAEFRKRSARPLALCSWPMYHNPVYPDYAWHPVEVALAFLEECAAIIPMAYWQKLWGMVWDPASPAAAAHWATICMDQMAEIAGPRPIIPAGRAYHIKGAPATAAAAAMFQQVCLERGAAGISWWSMEQAILIEDIWAELSRPSPWAGPPPPRLTEAGEARRWNYLEAVLKQGRQLDREGRLLRRYDEAG